MKSTVVDESLSSFKTNVLFQRIQTFYKINVDIVTYIYALKISKRVPNVILQQNPQDVFICQYKYVINEITTVKYVCSYMTKGEKGMGGTLKRVAKEC